MRVESMCLKITPAHRLEWTRDVFGNSVAIVDFTVASVATRNHERSRCRALAAIASGRWQGTLAVSFPVVYEPLETTIAAAYQATTYPDDVATIRDWLQCELPLPSQVEDAEAVIAQLGSLVHRVIKYQRRNEKGVRSPAETLALGSGSCRDMATLMMDAARFSASRPASSAAISIAPRRKPAAPRCTPGRRSICPRSVGGATTRRLANQRRTSIW